MTETLQARTSDATHASLRGARVAFGLRHGELLVLPVVALLVAWPQYSAPIQYNEAMFAVFGREILAGRLPYRDVFDQKPPLIYYLYAAVQAVTGDGFLVSRVTIFIAVGATAILVTLIARELYSRRLAFVAGLVFALTNGLVAVNENAGLDQLTLLPLTAATYLVVRWRRTRSDVLLIAAGASAGVALLLKPVALPTALVLGVVVIVTSRRLGPPLWLASSATVVGLAALLGLALLGLLPEAYEAIVVFGREYAAYGRAHSEPLERLVFWSLALGPLLLPASASMLVLALERSWRAAILWALLAGGAVGLALPGALLPYYAWAVAAPLALMAPAILEWLAPRSRSQRRLVVLPGVFGVVVMVSVAVLLPSALVPGESAGGARAVGEAIARASLPGDRLYVRANVPQVYYYADLPPAHRYFTPQAIAVRPPVEGEIVEALSNDPPAFVVIAEHDAAMSPALRVLLEERYAAFATAGDLAAYARR